VVEPSDLATHEEASSLVAEHALPVVEVSQLHDKAGEIAAAFHMHPSQQLRVIAVTGTDGKTSVCRFISAALNYLGMPCGYIGTIGWGIDELQPTALTTPDVAVLQQQLAELRNAGAQAVALEASSHGIAEGRLNPVAIDVAVLTNFGRDHLDYHRTIGAYRQAKARLFSWPTLNAVVVNGADELGSEIARSWPQRDLGVATAVSATVPSANNMQCVIYGDAANDQKHGSLATDADPIPGVCYTSLVATDITPSPLGIRFHLHADGESIAIQSALMGYFNVDNMLACAGVLLVLGHSLTVSAEALHRLTPVPGRMERFAVADKPVVVCVLRKLLIMLLLLTTIRVLNRHNKFLMTLLPDY